MSESLYSLLNEMDQNVEQYEVEKVSDFEVKKWKKNFEDRMSKESQKDENKSKTTEARKKTRNKLSNKSGKYVAAAALAFACCAGGLFHNQVQAQIEIAKISLQELMGKDVSKYVDSIDESISKDGITISVGDVVVDEDHLFVVYSVTNENEKEEVGMKDVTSEMPANLIFVEPSVNGWHKDGGSRGGARKVDEKTDLYVEEIDIAGVDTSKKVNYKLSFSNENEKIGTVSFVASGEELAANTKTYEVNHELTLGNGVVINLKELSVNEMQQRISAELVSGNVKDMNYAINLEGFDDQERKMMFYLADWNGKTGRFVLYYDDNSLMDNGSVSPSDVKSFTVTPYAKEIPAESGREGTEKVQIGEEFTINAQ